MLILAFIVCKLAHLVSTEAWRYCGSPDHSLCLFPGFFTFWSFWKTYFANRPLEKLIQKWSFLGRQSGWRRRPTGRRQTLPTWRGDAEVARGSAPEWLAPPPPEIFYFCFICLIFFFTLKDTQEPTIKKLNSNGRNMWHVEFFLSSPLSSN